MKDDEVIACEVKDLKDGFWDTPEGVLELQAMTDAYGEIHDIEMCEYLAQTGFTPLHCKMCDEEVPDTQIILRMKTGWWVVPHETCNHFVWYRVKIEESLV
tara:strand:+ start:48 stop:350 length:303 start_codon:yes stop_codon:yes gene_type:complete